MRARGSLDSRDLGGIEIVQDNTQQVLDELDKAVDKALTAIGMQVQTYATMAAPHDTGRLEGSITYATRNERSGVRSPATAKDAVPGDPQKGEVYIGTSVEYAAYQEYGTVRNMAHPFLTPAVQDHLQEYADIIKKMLSG